MLKLYLSVQLPIYACKLHTWYIMNNKIQVTHLIELKNLVRKTKLNGTDKYYLWYIWKLFYSCKSRKISLREWYLN